MITLQEGEDLLNDLLDDLDLGQEYKSLPLLRQASEVEEAILRAANALEILNYMKDEV